MGNLGGPRLVFGGSQKGSGRPRLGEEKLQNVSFSLTRALVEKMDRAAKQAGVNRSLWLRLLLEKRFE